MQTLAPAFQKVLHFLFISNQDHRFARRANSVSSLWFQRGLLLKSETQQQLDSLVASRTCLFKWWIPKSHPAERQGATLPLSHDTYVKFTVGTIPTHHPIGSSTYTDTQGKRNQKERISPQIRPIHQRFLSKSEECYSLGSYSHTSLPYDN